MRQAVEAYPQDRTPWLLLQSSSQKPGQPPTYQSPSPESTVFSRPYVRVWIPSCWNSLVPKKSRTDIASVPAFLSADNLEAQFPHVQVKRLDKMVSSPFIELPWSLLSRGQHKVHFWFLSFLMHEMCSSDGEVQTAVLLHYPTWCFCVGMCVCCVDVRYISVFTGSCVSTCA